mgnify:CR=1 FL=1
MYKYIGIIESDNMFYRVVFKKDNFEIEVYEVSDEALESVRMLEGWNPSNTGYYREEIIKTEFGDAIIYVFNI